MERIIRVCCSGCGMRIDVPENIGNGVGPVLCEECETVCEQSGVDTNEYRPEWDEE